MRLFYNGFLVLFIIISLVKCRAIKIEYQYPNGLTEQKQKELQSRVKVGYKLFKKNCESCHGITRKLKDTAIKLDLKNTGNYQSSFIKGDYKNHAFTQGLTNAELTNILLFLTVIKKE
jgi:mono/diheme cytochrome c family protein